MKNAQKKLFPVKKRNNIFYYIKNIIQKLFFKREEIENVENKEFKELENKEFNEKIKYADKYELERRIKGKIDKNEINVSDLTNLEKEKMIVFYRKQISLKKEKLNQIKNRVLKLKDDVK